MPAAFQVNSVGAKLRPANFGASKSRPIRQSQGKSVPSSALDQQPHGDRGDVALLQLAQRVLARSFLILAARTARISAHPLEQLIASVRGQFGRRARRTNRLVSKEIVGRNRLVVGRRPTSAAGSSVGMAGGPLSGGAGAGFFASSGSGSSLCSGGSAAGTPSNGGRFRILIGLHLHHRIAQTRARLLGRKSAGSDRLRRAAPAGRRPSPDFAAAGSGSTAAACRALPYRHERVGRRRAGLSYRLLGRRVAASPLQASCPTATEVTVTGRNASSPAWASVVRRPVVRPCMRTRTHPAPCDACSGPTA